jgi:hypothetical protein
MVSKLKLTPGQKVTLIVGSLSAFAVIIASIIQMPTDTEAVQMIINATRTAEARLTELATYAVSSSIPPTSTPPNSRVVGHVFWNTMPVIGARIELKVSGNYTD